MPSSPRQSSLGTEASLWFYRWDVRRFHWFYRWDIFPPALDAKFSLYSVKLLALLNTHQGAAEQPRSSRLCRPSIAGGRAQEAAAGAGRRQSCVTSSTALGRGKAETQNVPILDKQTPTRKL